MCRAIWSESAQVAADPIGAVHAVGEDDAVLIDDTHDAVGRQRADTQRVLEMLEPRADREHGQQPAYRSLTGRAKVTTH